MFVSNTGNKLRRNILLRRHNPTQSLPNPTFYVDFVVYDVSCLDTKVIINSYRVKQWTRFPCSWRVWLKMKA